ncbi:MAG: type II secretion system protein [Clostridia bacterium]
MRKNLTNKTKSKNSSLNFAMLKEKRGITLVALVVTIVVLLILAGVSLNLVLGNEGILTRSKESKTKTEIAEVKEKAQLDITEIQTLNGGKITYSELKTTLEKYGTVEYESDGKTIKGIKTTAGYEIPITELYTNKENWPTFTTVANEPDIKGFNVQNSYFVTWNTESSPYLISDGTRLDDVPPSDWYDYTASVNKWANVKTTGGGNDCYWVWIPRYAYQVPTRSSTASTIQIKFLEGKTNKPIGETTEITNTTPTPGSWVVHPAFTNAGNGGFGELSGIWVAKYEASSSSSIVVENPSEDQLANFGNSGSNLKVRVKPNVTSWRAISVGSIFTVCKNITTTGNSLEGTTNIDSHMMKNTEWGAVAYLSRSQYGKNSAVYNNPYWNDNDYNGTKYYSPITGLCGKTQNYTTKTYNDPNVYKYNTTEGKNASTTGNVYGVYDMVGGAWEYVAAVLSTKKSSGSYYNFTNIDTKYYESYDAYDNSKYGDAMYETSMNSEGSTSWDGDYSYFVTESNPVFERGGHASGWVSAGVFAFGRVNGGTAAGDSFRPCLVSPQ